jgi:hypothetical protein
MSKKFLTNEEIVKQSAETTRIEMEKLNKVLQDNSQKILKKKTKKKDSDSEYSDSDSEGETIVKEYYTRSKDNNIEKVKMRYENELKEIETKHHYTMLELSNAQVEINNYKNKLKIVENDIEIIENYFETATQVKDIYRIDFKKLFAECVNEKQVNMAELKITDDISELMGLLEEDSNNITNITNLILKNYLIKDFNNIEDMLLKINVNFKYNLDKRYGELHMRLFYYIFGIILSIILSWLLFF